MSEQIKDDGGPAFPHIDIVKDCGQGQVYEGLTKRDWFAGMALQGMLAKYGLGPVIENVDANLKCCANNAYLLADAMLKARDE